MFLLQVTLEVARPLSYYYIISYYITFEIFHVLNNNVIPIPLEVNNLLFQSVITHLL